MSALGEHLATGLTTVCRCWAVTRSDGVVYGFTDHDQPLEFDGITFRADAGLTAKSLVQGTGMSVDNTEALGVLSDDAITEVEIDQGRFDGAEVMSWLVNWADVAARKVQFRGHIGDIRRGGGAFHAELRGLTERLNQPRGRVFQKGCAAVLGDAECGLDLSDPAYSAEVTAGDVREGQVFELVGLDQFAERALERGRLRVLSGAGAGLVGVIKHDAQRGDTRRLDLWEAIRAEVIAGDLLRVEVGCDKRHETCGVKFANGVNFRGFPHIPGEDWLVSVPRGQGDDGGSLGV